MNISTTVFITETPHTALSGQVAPEQTHTNAQSARQRHVPLTMPHSQRYYWQRRWQQGERESMAAFEAGEGIVFDSDDPEDIVRWLHAPDGTDAAQD